MNNSDSLYIRYYDIKHGAFNLRMPDICDTDSKLRALQYLIYLLDKLKIANPYMWRS